VEVSLAAYLDTHGLVEFHAHKPEVDPHLHVLLDLLLPHRSSMLTATPMQRALFSWNLIVAFLSFTWLPNIPGEKSETVNYLYWRLKAYYAQQAAMEGIESDIMQLGSNNYG
jgi:hypothetical protein